MSIKDQGEVTIISSNDDGCKINWTITFNTHMLGRDNYGYNFKNMDSKSVTLWGCNWKFKLQGKRNASNYHNNIITINFEPIDIEIWARKGLKTKTSLTATYNSHAGHGSKTFNSEEGATPQGGYEVFPLTSNDICQSFSMQFNWDIKLDNHILLPNLSKRFSSLSRDLGKMLTNTKGHDVTIRCDGLKITAHKCILAGRSSVFAAMFESNMKEARESVVEINEVNPESIQAMLQWVYTCRISENKKPFILDLIRLAHLYEMPLLVEECQAILISQIKKENVTDILVVSDMVGAKEAKNAAIQFIIGNKSIIQMDEYLKKVSKELMCEVTMAALVKH